MIDTYLIEDENTLTGEIKYLISKYIPSICISGTYTNGPDALTSVVSGKPALFWVDMGLPLQDGKAFIEDVYSKTGIIPYVIFMSANNYTINDIYNCNAIVVDFLLKPISPDRLKYTELRINTLLNITQ